MVREIELTRDPRAFAAAVSGFLAQRAERNVAATVLASVLAGGFADSASLFGYGRDPGGEIAFAVLRTPPWPLLVGDLEPALATPLIDRWLAEDPGVPGVGGLPVSAGAVAAAWGERTGGTHHRRMSQALHALEEVVDPSRPAPGQLRQATDDERELLVEWCGAFEQEAFGTSDRSANMVDERLSYGGWWVWDDGGPASLVGATRPVAQAVRLGPVYTPPDRRGLGYASWAVAGVSRHALAGGARRCLLYTDLANPTSNKIYAHVGYRRIADWDDLAFKRAGP